MKVNKKWIIAASIAGALVFGIVIVVTVMQLAPSPGDAVEQFANAVDKKQPEELKEIIKPDDQKAPVNDASLTALINYLNENNNSYKVIKDSLDEQVEDKDFSATGQQISLIEDGKKWGIFPDYKLQVQTASIKVTGQNDGDAVDVSIGKLSGLKKQKDEDIYGPLLPGSYDVLMTVKNDLGTFMEEKKTEAWGNKQVTVVIDSHKLAREDKDVQKELLAAVDVFNKDMSVFQTSGFDISTLTNVTDEVKEDTSFVQDDFELIKDYVDEMHSQYLGAVVNLDDLNVDSFDKKWSAEVSALVSYNSKLRYREEKTFEDLSYQSVREYSLQYDPKAKKWLIADLMEREAIGSEDEDWDNKKELKVENPPVLKWSRNDESINL